MRLPKLEKRYRNLQRLLQPNQPPFKNQDGYAWAFLSKFRTAIEALLVDPVLNQQLYPNPTETVFARLKELWPDDTQFLDAIRGTQLVSVHFDQLRRFVQASGGSLPEYDDLF